MTSSGDSGRGSDERNRATNRLAKAKAERDRLTDRYDAAKGTRGEVDAQADLREAGEQLAAREAWVKWLERGY